MIIARIQLFVSLCGGRGAVVSVPMLLQYAKKRKKKKHYLQYELGELVDVQESAFFFFSFFLLLMYLICLDSCEGAAVDRSRDFVVDPVKLRSVVALCSIFTRL